MSKPLFVAISDIHFNVNNLELASTALQAALDKSEELDIPLVIAGDLHDTKAIIRAEVANRLLNILNKAKMEKVYILVGNHDLINEKGEEHGLNYLSSHAWVISSPVSLTIEDREVMFIPYQNTVQKFKTALAKAPKGSLIVCHQGVQGAHLGDYVQDKTSIEAGALNDYTLISGHYHRHQTVGTLTYIGSPFTHTFGESSDGDKGYLIVADDGTFERSILNLRRHVKISIDAYPGVERITLYPGVNTDDLLWLQIHGNKDELNKIDKEKLGQLILGHSNFKLDLIPDEMVIKDATSCEPQTAQERLDSLIERSNDHTSQAAVMKKFWRGLL